eukprot:TRINITY_DN14273_c0_g1_i1.p2 TRINITY_DN14273_c0_g1~~TRINITY_DN14273_c0_g1_i1.p2  ORF type:complete len:161 (+),score=41.61 TRINITY_DN14273_c0_g1_i1:43-525(+)
MGNCADKTAVAMHPPRYIPPDEARRKTREGWQALLTEREFRVLRCKATEAPHSGAYNDSFPTRGYFGCRGCGAPLFSAAAKFKCGCGWPAFDKAYRGAVMTHGDLSAGMARTEILCSRCNGHLGHVFNGEHMTSTNQRHCVNSTSIRYFDHDLVLQEARV